MAVRNRQPLPQPEQVKFPLSTNEASLKRDENLFPQKAEREMQVFKDGDVLKVNLWGDQKVSGTYTVGPDGAITLPLLGDITVFGKDRKEVMEAVKAAAQKYYDSPIVDISVEKYSARYAYAFGAFNKSGAIELNPSDSLLTVIGKAGGIAQRENDRGQSLGMPRIARVIRGSKGIAMLDVKSLVNGEDLKSNIAILPGDMIYVPRDDAPTISVLGEVLQPGILGLSPGMDAVQAIALAQGLTRDGNPRDVRVLRKWWSNQPEVYQLNMAAIQTGNPHAAIMLQDQDIVYVPMRGLAKLNYHIAQVTPAFSTILFFQDFRNAIHNGGVF